MSQRMSGITEAKARYYASERPGDLLDRANPLLGLANARTTGTADHQQKRQLWNGATPGVTPA